MSKRYKRVYTGYFAWDYGQEEEKLNQYSREGWQLVNANGFFGKLKKNPEVCYRYQLDYQPNIEDVGRYIETFREQGWELVTRTWNGWNYFRKPYDATLPEEEYHIFTERDFMGEMPKQLMKILLGISIPLGVSVVCAGVLVYLNAKIADLVFLGVVLFELAMLCYGFLALKKLGKRGKVRYARTYCSLFLIVLILGFGANIYLRAESSSIRFFHQSEISNVDAEGLGRSFGCWSPKYGDNFNLDVTVTADGPLTLCLVDTGSGEKLFEKQFQVQDTTESISERMWLDAGTYEIVLTEYTEGNLQLDFELR